LFDENRSPKQICGHPELQIKNTPHPRAVPFAGAHKPLPRNPVQPMDGSIPAQIQICFSYVRWRTEFPERTGNNLAVPASSSPP
jgi:hypothetical protein